MWFFIALSAVLAFQLWAYVEKTDEYKFLANRYEQIGVRAIEQATNKLDILKSLEGELSNAEQEGRGFYSSINFKRYKGAITKVLSHFEPDGLRDILFSPRPSSPSQYLKNL